MCFTIIWLIEIVFKNIKPDYLFKLGPSDETVWTEVPCYMYSKCRNIREVWHDKDPSLLKGPERRA
jgi:hypothetical protein